MKSSSKYLTRWHRSNQQEGHNPYALMRMKENP